MLCPIEPASEIARSSDEERLDPIRRLGPRFHRGPPSGRQLPSDSPTSRLILETTSDCSVTTVRPAASASMGSDLPRSRRSRRPAGRGVATPSFRAAKGSVPVEPAAVLLRTSYGTVRVDVVEVRQVELDCPSDDSGDRFACLRACLGGVEVITPVAEPGPLIAMKLQVVMNRSVDKQGTDLLDIMRLTVDEVTRPAALSQIGSVDAAVARDIALHVDLWFVRGRERALRWIPGAGGRDLTSEDLDLVAELLNDAAQR